MNTTYPGRPDYIGPDSEMAGYVHHAIQYEYCWSFKERIEAIRNTKPAHEIEMRLHCLVYLDPTSQPWVNADWRKASAPYDTKIIAQIVGLVPDAPWDGRQLVLPKETA